MSIFAVVNLSDKFDSLKDEMQMYQQNINNNISWFYAAMAIVITVLIVGLYFLVTESIKKGIQKGISDVEGAVRREIALYQAENERLMANIDEKILNIIKANYPLKWAKGFILAENLLKEGRYLEIANLQGPINWDAPTTQITLNARNGNKPLFFKIVEAGESNLTLEIFNYSSILHGNTIEWAVIWQKKYD